MRMSQALGNVLKNAIQHTQAGGTIVVRAEVESHGAVVVSVIDDGTGIQAADLPHVFQRFYRTGQSRSQGIAGTGLGLAITRAIVEAHGGTVGIASGGLGKGATVQLPPSPEKARWWSVLTLVMMAPASVPGQRIRQSGGRGSRTRRTHPSSSRMGEEKLDSRGMAPSHPLVGCGAHRGQGIQVPGHTGALRQEGIQLRRPDPFAACPDPVWATVAPEVLNRLPGATLYSSGSPRPL